MARRSMVCVHRLFGRMGIKSVLKQTLRRLLCVSLACMAVAAAAQSYPAKPVRIVVPYSPGGGLDVTARLVAPKLAELLGQSVIVDNRPGASGTVGSDQVAKTAPDGYTLLLAGRGPIIAAPFTYPNLAYSPSRDLAAVTRAVSFPYILVVHPLVPARNARDLIALAKASPGKLNMVSGGAGGGQHLAGELFNSMAGTKMTHIPYKGTGPATIDLMGGHADLGFLDPAVLPQVKAGKLRALGVSSKRRYQPHPEIPPIHESGLPGYDWDTWYALFAPAGMPANLVARINEAVGQALAHPDVRQKLLAAGLVPAHSTPEELRRSVEQDTKMLARLIKEANIKPN
jgi:tripartite-type tricarboxylate transporter receptor subunit TctC